MKQSYPDTNQCVHTLKPGLDFIPSTNRILLSRDLNEGVLTLPYADDDYFVPSYLKDSDQLIGNSRHANEERERVNAHGGEAVPASCHKGQISPQGNNNKNNKGLQKAKKATPYHPTDARLVSEIAIGTQDIIVKCKCVGGAVRHKGGGARGKVTEFSRKSRTRCETHARNLPVDSVKAFLTLTYPNDFPTDGRRVKRDLDVMRKWLKRRGVNDFWFEEFQKRGAPHFHLFLDRYPLAGVKAIAAAWYKIVGSGDPKHLAWHLGELSGRPCLEYVRKPHAASWYASKYAVKAEQKQVPSDFLHVGRFWGYSRLWKPEWKFFYGHGFTCLADSLHAIKAFREARGIQKPMTPVTHYSSTLRGAMDEGFDYWFANWTPF